MFPMLSITLSLFLAFLLALLVVYRLFLHPFAGIPGPLWQKVSGVPRIWQCYKGNRHLSEWKAHEKHGSVIRTAPNTIVFSSLSAYNQIHAKNSNVSKGVEFYGLLDGGAEGGKSVQMTADNDEHAERRKTLNRAMPSREVTFRIINQLAQTFAKMAGSCSINPMGVGKGMKDWTAPIDISIPSRWYSFDVIIKVAFGESLNMLKSAEYRWVPDCLRSLSIFLYWAGYAPFVPFWRWFLGSTLPFWLRMQTAMDAQIYGKFANDMVVRRATRLHEKSEAGTEEPDIFGNLLKAKTYNPYDLRAESSLFIAAGSDGMGFTIDATLSYWAQDPLIFKRVSKEIRSCFPSTDSITGSKLSTLRYLRACVDETMRLCPPKASSLPREVQTGGITLDGIYVPKGMTVGTSIYALHRDPNIFPSPLAYDPDRWLRKSQVQEAFAPFLRGPRMCPGVKIAYEGILLALVHVVLLYDVRAADMKVTDSGDANFPFQDWILGYAHSFIELEERTS